MSLFSKNNTTKRSKRKSKAKRARASTGRAKAFLWWLMGLATSLVLMMVFVLSDHGLYELYQLKRQQAMIEERIQELEIENEQMAEEKQRLESDMEYIERLARERYRMAREGEKVFRVIPKSEGTTSK
jgi:cell division protein FtsB